MRFDNAFLTSKGNVGMQFVGFKNRTLTVYRDHKGELVYSEDANEKEQQILRDQYIRREKWYAPKGKKVNA